MDYDKKIAKLNKKKQKKLEKEKKLKAELAELTDDDILYKEGLYAGSEINFKMAGHTLQMIGFISLIAGVAIQSMGLALLFCGSGVGLMTAAGGLHIASAQYRKKWQMYKTEATNRETKKMTADFQKAREQEKLNENQMLVNKNTERTESKESSLEL